MIEMRIVGVRVEMPHQQPVLMLTETDGERSLPILVGSAEATAIAMQMQGMVPPRPMTHDLLKDVLTAVDRTLTEVRVVDFREGTFYGELVFDGDVTVSARPSDAVALAVRCQVPVYVADAVLDEVGIVIPESADELEDDDGDVPPITDPEGELERFREFLDHVSPEDFDPEESGDFASGDASSSAPASEAGDESGIEPSRSESPDSEESGTTESGDTLPDDMGAGDTELGDTEPGDEEHR